jgi:hypothetical protein
MVFSTQLFHFYGWRQVQIGNKVYAKQLFLFSQGSRPLKAMPGTTAACCCFLMARVFCICK